MVNAGRILIIPKGEWSNLTNYEMLDLVSFDKVAYIARQASVGVNPSTDSQMTYWQPFGSVADIATTEKPGLVMPDGSTITIDNTGLITAVLGVSDLRDVVLNNLADGEVLQYDSGSQRWRNAKISLEDAEKSIATVENGSTMSKTYVIGEQFIRENILFKAKTNIASGTDWSDLVLNTNYEVSPLITVQIKSLEDKIGDLAQLRTTAKSDLVESINELANRSVTIDYTGTASDTGVRYQRVGIDGVYTEVSGTKYMEQTVTLSTSGTTTVTFTNAAITSGSVIEPYYSEYGFAADSIVTTNGQSVLTLPKVDTAISLTVRIYIK